MDLYIQENGTKLSKEKIILSYPMKKELKN
ncbi:hypothetical protein C095_02560 [Fusobacterium necrophorum subsp. funduliforme B35]|uniref:Uncharacterized protein n=1 Tax=Fusobacterium necrophorum subsp. funduliforme B35 TaxID=1226633 RepID=A0A0B4ERN7_9FUSO|nr:hypothetical protein C095_02560 [Fusobacterium necrophorum subsp. funduliforme B35]